MHPELPRSSLSKPSASSSPTKDVLSTLDETNWGTQGPALPVPGVVVVFSRGQPCMRAAALVEGRIVVGRAALDGLTLDDDRLSREHAEIAVANGRWRVRDLNSRNGTLVDGVPVHAPWEGERPACIGLGQSVIVPVDDVTRFATTPVEITSDGRVLGPTLRLALTRIERAAAAGDGLLITGESGSGKEVAARAFHAAGPGGPFVAVNCAAIPEGVAERLFFGATKGAYSGASDNVEGYVQSADGGTLFLDEVGELDLAVQAKLLRVLENREVMQLGATTARKVNIRICWATHRNLRAAVAEGKFRADLYYRIGLREVRLPPLRERLEEVAFLVDAEARAGGCTVHTRLVQACLVRPWPGNVRELRGALRNATDDARLAELHEVRAEHLPPSAGLPMKDDSAAPRSRAPRGFTKPEVEAALAANDGNVAATARALNLHRTQLYRVMKALDIERRDEPTLGPLRGPSGS